MWNADDATFAAAVRTQFKQSFLEDMLNYLYDIQESKGKQNDLVSSIHHLWNAEDAELGAAIHKQFKQSSLDDMLTCLYDIESQGKQNDLVSHIDQLWNADDAAFGAMIRARFKQSFLEVAEIEALEAMGIYWESCRKAVEIEEESQ